MFSLCTSELLLGTTGVTGDSIGSGELWGREEASLATVVGRVRWVKRDQFEEVGWDHLWGSLFGYEANFKWLGLGSDSWDFHLAWLNTRWFSSTYLSLGLHFLESPFECAKKYWIGTECFLQDPPPMLYDSSRLPSLSWTILIRLKFWVFLCSKVFNYSCTYAEFTNLRVLSSISTFWSVVDVENTDVLKIDPYCDRVYIQNLSLSMTGLPLCEGSSESAGNRETAFVFMKPMIHNYY